MFKMAKKILAIDGNSSSASGSSSSKSKAKNKASAEDDFAPPPPANKPKTTDELGDFSKLQEDPRLPLNVRQIFKITKSWKAIARTMAKTGTVMFLNLFQENEDLFYLFDRFQHLKRTEIQESMELKEHAATVMSTLDQSISSLNDYDNFVNYLRSIGELHRKVPDFRRDHFWKIEEPFMKAVKQTLEERCNETIEEIYRIAIKLIIETIADGYGFDDDQKAAATGMANDNEGGGAGGNTKSNAGSSNPANNKRSDNINNQQQQQQQHRGVNQNNDRDRGTHRGLKEGAEQRFNAAPGCPVFHANLHRSTSSDPRACQATCSSMITIPMNSREFLDYSDNDNNKTGPKSHLVSCKDFNCPTFDAVIPGITAETTISSSEQATEKDNCNLRLQVNIASPLPTSTTTIEQRDNFHELSSEPLECNYNNNIQKQHSTRNACTNNNNNDLVDLDNNHNDRRKGNCFEIIDNCCYNKNVAVSEEKGTKISQINCVNGPDDASKEARLRATMQILRQILTIVSISARKPQEANGDLSMQLALKKNKNEKKSKLVQDRNQLLHKKDKSDNNDKNDNHHDPHCDHKSKSHKQFNSLSKLQSSLLDAKSTFKAKTMANEKDQRNNNDPYYYHSCNGKQIRLGRASKARGPYRESIKCLAAQQSLELDNTNNNNGLEMKACNCAGCQSNDIRLAPPVWLRHRSRKGPFIVQHKLLITKGIIRGQERLGFASCKKGSRNGDVVQELRLETIGIEEISCRNYNKFDGNATTEPNSLEISEQFNNHQNEKLQIVMRAHQLNSTATNYCANSNHHVKLSACCARENNKLQLRRNQTGGSCLFVATKSRKTSYRVKATSKRLRKNKNNNATIQSKSNGTHLKTDRILMRLTKEKDNLVGAERAHRVVACTSRLGRIPRPCTKGFMEADVEAASPATIQIDSKHSMESIKQDCNSTKLSNKSTSQTRNCTPIANNHCSNVGLVDEHGAIETREPHTNIDWCFKLNEMQPVDRVRASKLLNGSRRHRNQRNPFKSLYKASLCNSTYCSRMSRLNRIAGCVHKGHDDADDWTCIAAAESNLDDRTKVRGAHFEASRTNLADHIQEGTLAKSYDAQDSITAANGVTPLSSDPEELLELVKILYSLRKLDNKNNNNDKPFDQDSRIRMAGHNSNGFSTTHGVPRTLVYG